VGAGLIGRKRAAAIKAFKECKLKIIADINFEKSESLANEFGAEVDLNWENVVNRKDIDILIIATINKFLCPISMAALRNNKHVLCEKPLGRNVDESVQILKIATESKKVLKTGFNHRHHPAINKAKSLIDRDVIGKINYIRCIYGHGGRPGYEKDWRASKELCGGGELLDQGVHIVDLSRWFMGEFEEAYGQVNTFYWKMEVEDNAFAIFRTKEKQTAVMHASWTQWKNKFLFEVFGEKGYIVIDGLGGSYGTEKLIIGKTKITDGRYVGGVPDEEVIEFPGPDISWIEEWKEFLSAIEESREPLGSGYDGYMANKMIEAIYRSAALNRLVKIK
jgi:predicted dehydrogenase